MLFAALAPLYLTYKIGPRNLLLLLRLHKGSRDNVTRPISFVKILLQNGSHVFINLGDRARLEIVFFKFSSIRCSERTLHQNTIVRVEVGFWYG